MLVHKKCKKVKTQKLINLKLPFFFKAIFFDTVCHFFFYKVEITFSLNYFLFSIQSSKLSGNMRKLRGKLHNDTIYPPCGQVFNNKTIESFENEYIYLTDPV